VTPRTCQNPSNPTAAPAATHVDMTALRDARRLNANMHWQVNNVE